jgi:antiphage defense system Thoeris ThsB-like protein
MLATYGLRKVRRLPTRVFISFDYDRDRGVAALLGGQLRGSSRFRVQNWSMKEAAPQRLWKDEARRRMNRSDVVLVVVGSQTHRAPGVLAEVAMARAARPPVPIRQVIGYRNLSPSRVPNAGRLYRWGQENLAQILAVPRRRAG